MQKIFQILDNYTRKIVTKAKMREISKKFCMREGDSISLQNAGVSHKMRETWRICVDHIIEILIMISSYKCFSLASYLFLKKIQHYYDYWNHFVFYWITSTVFLIIICFSSLSINAKKKFWGVPHLLHMCVIFASCILLF